MVMERIRCRGGGAD